MHGNIWEYSSRYEVVRFRFALGCAMMDLCEPDNPSYSFIAVQPSCEFLLWQEIDMAHLLWWQVEEFPMNDKRLDQHLFGAIYFGISVIYRGLSSS